MYEELRWLLLGFFIIVAIVNAIKIARLKVFHFENDGVVFMIKYYHPAKKGVIFPLIKYPVSDIRTLKIERTLYSNVIILDVNLEKKGRPLHIKMKVSDISYRAYRNIINSFFVVRS